jgi:hypothetical protein
MIFRFSANVEKLLQYVTKKRQSSGFDTITITHVLMKAISIALSEMPSLNGHVVGQDFYPHKVDAVDLSVLVDTEIQQTTPNGDSVPETTASMIKISDADSKSTEAIANELTSKLKEVKTMIQQEARMSALPRNASDVQIVMHQLRQMVPGMARKLWGEVWYGLAARYGIVLPWSKMTAYPHGVCTVITSPDAENDLDIYFAPHASSSMITSAPIIVTMGGTRISPSNESKKRLTGKATVNCGVMIHNLAATTAEGKQFVARLRTLLNDPSSLDGLYEQILRKKEESKYAILVQQAKALLD